MEDHEMHVIQAAALYEGLCISIGCMTEQGVIELGVLHHSRVEKEALAGVRDVVIHKAEGKWAVTPVSDLGHLFMEMRS